MTVYLMFGGSASGNVRMLLRIFLPGCPHPSHPLSKPIVYTSEPAGTFHALAQQSA
jgi:hypothetical protein